MTFGKTPTREQGLKTEEIDKAVSTNAVFWEQASELLRKNFKMKFYLRGGQKGYHVILENAPEEQRIVVIERNTKVVQAALIDALALFHTNATHSTQTSILLPLTPSNWDEKVGPSATIDMKPPNPRIPWAIEIDGAPLMGERSKPQRTYRLLDAIQMAQNEGATTARLPISKAARMYFKARHRRSGWVSDALAKEDTNLSTWCLDNDENYKTLYRVLQRGDDIPHAKAVLSKIAGKPEEKMWPVIDWS
jgi:hypothetical protein